MKYTGWPNETEIYVEEKLKQHVSKFVCYLTWKQKTTTVQHDSLPLWKIVTFSHWIQSPHPVWVNLSMYKTSQCALKNLLHPQEESHWLSRRLSVGYKKYPVVDLGQGCQVSAYKLSAEPIEKVEMWSQRWKFIVCVWSSLDPRSRMRRQGLDRTEKFA